jgi:hypothetical protein
LEILGDNLKNAVPNDLAIFGGVKVLNAQALFDVIILQGSEKRIPNEWSDLAHSGESEEFRTGGGEVEIASLVKKDIQATRD